MSNEDTIDTESAIDCFCCGKVLTNWVYQSKFRDTMVEVHPMRGLHFLTYGHYGSTVFDPMDGTQLDIAICDECIKTRIERIRGTGVKNI